MNHGDFTTMHYISIESLVTKQSEKTCCVRFIHFILFLSCNNTILVFFIKMASALELEQYITNSDLFR